MNIEVADWLNGFTEHLKLMSDKYGGQSAYGREVGISAHYMSLLINKRYQEVTRPMLLELAEKSNYRREKHREIVEMFNQIEWKEIKKEYGVQYENTRRRERTEFRGETGVINQSEVIENQKVLFTVKASPAQDIYLITRYMSMRNTIPIENENIPVLRKALLHNLCADLIKLDEKELR